MSAVAEPPKKLKRKSEFDTRSVTPTQHPPIVHPAIDKPMVHEADIIVPEHDAMKADYLDQLKFNEEPVTILIHRSGERFSPRTTDLIAVGGIKAEMLFKNGWVQIGYLPRGIAITTKRKYVERLAHSKVEHVQTVVLEPESERPKNVTERLTVASCAFSVMKDDNPRGIEWLQALLREA